VQLTATGHDEQYLMRSYQSVLRELALMESEVKSPQEEELFGECEKLVFDQICYALVYDILDFLNEAPTEEEREAVYRQVFLNEAPGEAEERAAVLRQLFDACQL